MERRPYDFGSRESVMNPVDPLCCPLCGEENQCALARGRGNCWCFSRSIPDEVLARVPLEAQEKACVCERCAFDSFNPTSVYEKMRAILKRRQGG